MNRKDIQSVVKVLPEFTLLNQRFQVKISGSNQADIYFGRFSTAHPLKLFFLKHSKQFDLCRGCKVSDLIQEQGAAFLVFFMQAGFAATAATIVSGAMAERTRFTSYIICSAVLTALIYPVVGHWIWGGGWLSDLGIIDFAGSTVVHSVGGWVGLAGVIILGPRVGKYIRSNGQIKVKALPGHNLPLAALGVFILWFGWFGFNAGSTTSGTDLSIGFIAANTNLSAAAGAIGTGLLVFFLLKVTIGLRVSPEEELRGLDIGEHGSEAYSGFQIFISQ